MLKFLRILENNQLLETPYCVVFTKDFNFIQEKRLIYTSINLTYDILISDCYMGRPLITVKHFTEFDTVKIHNPNNYDEYFIDFLVFKDGLFNTHVWCIDNDESDSIPFSNGCIDWEDSNSISFIELVEDEKTLTTEELEKINKIKKDFICSQL
jgi:hypothetical protein